MTRDTDAPAGWAPAGKDTGIVKSKGTARLPVLEGQEPLPMGARKPSWLKVRSPGGDNYRRLKKLMRGQRLHSVCEEAGCPNIGECWEAGTATFLILGDVCTRACKYCAIAHGMPTELDLDEPRRVAEAVAELELEHVVVTSVNRDELEDGGAAIFAETIRLTQKARPGCTIEVLIPDFKGDEDALRAVVDARPDILNHNLETVERLHPWARPGGRYWRSISYLGAAKRMDPSMLTKSGVILGMGETEEEIRQAMLDLRKASVDILTLGQYLRPSEHHAPVARWVMPAEFAEWKRVGEAEMGYRHVESGPLVRSSYHAETQARTVQAGEVGELHDILEADVPAPAEVVSANGAGPESANDARSVSANGARPAGTGRASAPPRLVQIDPVRGPA
ncbi:MAG TPA: lipoyl synthase [Thermohalobaculum sp.]|nr:lipoyl synthase [Thermohalobaculum sp.]